MNYVPNVKYECRPEYPITSLRKFKVKSSVFVFSLIFHQNFFLHLVCGNIMANDLSCFVALLIAV